VRLALIVGLLLAAVTTAHAGWVKARVSGTPNDVEVWGPGLFSVSTEQGAWLMASDGGTLGQPIPTGDLVGSYYLNANCFMGFQAQTSGTVNRGSGCGSNASVFKDFVTLSRVESTSSGAAYAVATQGDVVQLAFAPVDRVDERPWFSPLDQDIFGQPMTLGAAQLGSTEHALLAARAGIGSPQVEFHWSVDGGTPTRVYTFTDTLAPAREVQAIDVFPSGGSTPNALYGFATGLYRGTLVADGGSVFQAVELPVPPGTRQVPGVDVNTGVGSASGDGFGMATVRTGGVVTLLSAVPATRPEDVGKRWRVNPTLPAEATTPRYLECHGAQLCVIAQAVDAPNNVLIYTNDAGPTLIVDPETFVREGTTRVLPIFVKDEDGDAVLVTASGGGPQLEVSTREVADGGVELLLDAGTVCQDVVIPITVTATDGLAEHARDAGVAVRVLHTEPPGAPGVGSRNIVAEAGQQPVRLEFTPSTGTCPIARYSWFRVPDTAPLEGISGLSATVPIPPTLCKPNGETYRYGVVAFDGANLASAPAEVILQVRPWGPPQAPFPGGETVDIQAPEGRRLAPENTHECARPGTDFPGVDTVWELRGGGVPDGGVKLFTDDGGPISGTSAVTPALHIETENCARGALEFSVQHVVRGSRTDAGVGPSSTVQVTVRPNWNSPVEGELKLSEPVATSTTVVGTASVEGVTCLEEREVFARISAQPVNGGGPERSGRFRVPGPWSLPVGDFCEGGAYSITGELLAEGQGLQAEALTGGEHAALRVASQAAQPRTVVVPPIPVLLRPIEDARLTARCGEAARGTLEQRLPEPCSNLPLRWEQVRGPPLTPASFTGRQIELVTQDTDFEALIGESVVLRVSSPIPGQANPIEQPVLITTEPFVEVQRRTEKATGTEANLLGVFVELRNTTECGVSRVEHVEQLGGVDYVPGSARFNGTPVEAEVEAGMLKVSGLVLEGDTTGQLTYVVRPRLLEEVRFEGQSSLKGVPISQPLAEPPPGGCGCTGGGSGFAALGLAGLIAALRRRRGR
jgi:uncharacterized protein (TIGR03382 family)